MQSNSYLSNSVRAITETHFHECAFALLFFYFSLFLSVRVCV